MGWDQEYGAAMAVAAQFDIPREDADAMWVRYQAIGQQVELGLIADAEGLKRFDLFCTELAAKRGLERIASRLFRDLDPTKP